MTVMDRVDTRRVGTCSEVISHGTNEYGYPIIKVDGKAQYIHRVHYEDAFGPIPEGYILRHTCDNRRCINPLHLILGTHTENVADRVARGRSAYGTGNGRAKLDEEKVKYVLSAHGSNYELAQTFGVDPKTIRAIREGRTWRHVPR